MGGAQSGRHPPREEASAGPQPNTERSLREMRQYRALLEFTAILHHVKPSVSIARGEARSAGVPHSSVAQHRSIVSRSRLLHPVFRRTVALRFSPVRRDIRQQSPITNDPTRIMLPFCGPSICGAVEEDGRRVAPHPAR
jgi:hypothetical protein